MTDELTRRLALDLDGWFEALVAQHQALVFGVCQRALRDHEEAEEVAQDAFVRAYRALSTYPAERIRELHLRAWLARIALNASRNRLARRNLPTAPLDGAAELPAAERDRPDTVAERRESNERWATLLDELPRHYRLAVELRHVHGLSYPEIAEALDRPLGTVKVHVHRGVRLLRTAYEAQLVDADSIARPRPSPSQARRTAEVPA